MNFKKWVKSLQTAGYNDARTAPILIPKLKSVWNKPQQTTNLVEKKSNFGDSVFVKTCDELVIGLHPNFAMAVKPRQPQV